MHDDQHGTAIVALAALRSAARVVGKDLGAMRAVVCGAGASGIAVSKILLAAGIGEIGLADSKGMIYDGRDGLNPVKAELARSTNASGFAGAPEAALRDADVFIGLSGATLPEDALARMAPGAIAFLLSNPEPEIHPDVARGTPPWSPPGAATSPTRSTTRWPSPASSARPSTSARPRSPRT